MEPRAVRLALAPLALLAAAPAGRAELPELGSLLVFPLVDARAGVTSLVTVTNADPAGAALSIEVVHVVDCLEFNRTYALPGRDTLSVLANQAFPSGGQGYAFAFAKNAAGQAVSANHLCGSVLHLDPARALEFQVQAISFRAVAAAGFLTDVDGDTRRDLNGVEYEAAPDELVFPRFLGQSTAHRSELVLLNLTGDASFLATVDLRIANDNGGIYSAQHAFRCWTRTSLASISSLFGHDFLVSTNHSVNESFLFRETGWFLVDGRTAAAGAQVQSDPALLAVLVEPAAHSSAALPFARGTQTNGALRPIHSTWQPPAVPPNGGVLGS